MPKYITLINWTDQGAKSFRDSPDRYEAVQRAGAGSGVRFTDCYWTLGQYDLVAVVEAPSDEALTATLLAAAGNGAIRTSTMRAFDADEMRSVIANVG